MTSVAAYLRLVKFEHTVFALPFALLGAFLAAGGPPPFSKLGWILLAMVGARSAAMAFNRLADLRYDRENPRTRSWPLVKGEVTPRSALHFFALSGAVFFAAASQLNRLTLILSPVAFFLITFYSLTKRFTAACHFFLGAALACAPIGAWLAIRPEFHPLPLLLSGGVLLWAAGFDILYACQDVDFDRQKGLHSIPARFGIPAALWIARALHLAAAGTFASLALFTPAGPWFWGGVALMAALLAYEHSLVKADDLSRIDAAFFTVNGFVSVLFMVAVIADRALG